MPGKVYLVGAGPGDPGLLTVKGRRCLELADVVIYDYLANPQLLEHAPGAALRLPVGKHGGGARVEQDVINCTLVEHARAGKTVVRLKGGDPFIFGRGGEEAEALHEAGIEFEIVPGVSSAIAVPAYAGIPLTHRDLASNVVFTTGYEYPGKPELAVDWTRLARSGSTLVILMTTRQLRRNMEQLAAGGLPPQTPVAVIEWGTRARQRTVVGTLNDIADHAAAAGVHPPALAVVGDVVRLREKLQWRERQPLFGRRIMITRARAQAAEFAARLEALGAEVIAFPTIETVPPPSWAPLDAALRRAEAFDWVIFTSANGVDAFFDRLRTIGADIREWHRAQFAAIGPQTAATLERRGVRIAAVPEDFRAEGVIELLAHRDPAGKRILLPRAAGARELLPRQLAAMGAQVEEVITYRSAVPQRYDDELRAALGRGDIDLITFTSSSTVEHFAQLFADCLPTIRRESVVACIGPVTAATAQRHGFRVDVQPQQYTIADLVAAIAAYYAGSGS